MAYHSQLILKDYQLPVHIGWPEAERLQPQMLLLTITIRFHKPPTGCESDELSDTYCYDQLLSSIQQHCQGKTYKLIEYFANDIYKLIKSQLSTNELALCVTKVNPPIAELSGGASFQISDWSE